MASLELGPDVLKDIVQAGIFEVLPQAKRDELVKQAIANLLIEPADHFGKRIATSALQEAFNQAIREVARDVVREHLAEPELRAEVTEQIRVTLAAYLKEKSWMADTIGYAIGERVAKALEGFE